MLKILKADKDIIYGDGILYQLDIQISLNYFMSHRAKSRCNHGSRLRKLTIRPIYISKRYYINCSKC